MTSEREIKEQVRDQYAARARKVKESGEGCCGSASPKRARCAAIAATSSAS